MSHPHSYPRGAWWHLLRPESQIIIQALLSHPVCNFAQLKVYTGLTHPQLQSFLRPLENTGIINRVRLQRPARNCIYSLNPAHIPALINDFKEAAA